MDGLLPMKESEPTSTDSSRALFFARHHCDDFLRFSTYVQRCAAIFYYMMYRFVGLVVHAFGAEMLRTTYSTNTSRPGFEFFSQPTDIHHSFADVIITKCNVSLVPRIANHAESCSTYSTHRRRDVWSWIRY